MIYRDKKEIKRIKLPQILNLEKKEKE